MTEPSAKVIADSISEVGDRVTTLEVIIHRFVLSELNTHRVFSRNSASSRAIPLQKQLDRVRDNPAIPVVWPAEQKGMQGGDEVEATADAERAWLAARDNAVNVAQVMGPGYGVHKSVVNRLLEPFMWHTVIVTATDWDGFWEQRCSPLAQPEIRVAAEAMKAVYDASTPRQVADWDWHLPYIDEEDREWAAYKYKDRVPGRSALPTLAKISAARCARVSLLNHDGKRDQYVDLGLYERLVSASPMHSSPLEHPCTPRTTNCATVTVRVSNDIDIAARSGEPAGSMYQIQRPRYGNLLGWHQLRYDVDI